MNSGSSVASNRSNRSHQSQRSLQSQRSNRSNSSKKSIPPILPPLNSNNNTNNGHVISSDGSIASHASHASHSSRSSRASTSSKRSTSSKHSQQRNSSIPTIPPPLLPPEPSSSSDAGSVTSYSSRQSTSVSSKQSKARSTSSNASVQSHHSHQSHQSMQSISLQSTTSTSTSRSSKTIRSSRGIQSASLLSEGLSHLRNHTNYPLAIQLFTQALSSYQRNEGGNPPEGGTEERIERTLATLYAYRCEALYEIGSYDASVRDARSALECERIAGCKRTLISALGGGGGGGDLYGSRNHHTENHGNHNNHNNNLLHPEKGPTLRSKVLMLMGSSLLRQGIIEGTADALEGSLDVAQKALEDSEDYTESERRASSSHQEAVSLLQDTIMVRSQLELKKLSKFEALKTRLEHNSRGRYSVEDIQNALEIAPKSLMFQEEYIKYLIFRKRWFAVANYCERVAAENVKMEGVHASSDCGGGGGGGGDYLCDLDPFPNIPPLEELTVDDFAEQKKKGSIPPYLRMVGDRAARDVAFRLPKELVPYYLRALRLEERYGAAVLAGKALLEFDASAKKEQDLVRFVDRRILGREMDKLERTIKLKEEGDGLFRDGYFERAAAMYGECLIIDEEGKSSSGLNKETSARFKDVSGTEAFAKPAEAGGRLHAVLHSNRAACFSSLGRYEDAVKESSHALDTHNMYMKAMLRRARCYLKIGEGEKAKEDFTRWVTLVNGAKMVPFPPENQGPACFFDMPANVSKGELSAVKNEMSEIGLSVETVSESKSRGDRASFKKRISFTKRKSSKKQMRDSGDVIEGSSKKRLSFTKKNSNKSMRDSANAAAATRGHNSNPGKRGPAMKFLVGISNFFESLGFPACMKKDVADQVVTNPPAGGSRSIPDFHSLHNQGRSASQPPPMQKQNSNRQKVPPQSAFKKDPPSASMLMRHRPPFEHPLDPPQEIDSSKNYYTVLGLKENASQSDIKQAYFKIAKENHPDRNGSQQARMMFDEAKAAYDILGNKDKKKAYDRKRNGGLEP